MQFLIRRADARPEVLINILQRRNNSLWKKVKKNSKSTSLLTWLPRLFTRRFLWAPSWTNKGAALFVTWFIRNGKRKLKCGQCSYLERQILLTNNKRKTIESHVSDPIIFHRKLGRFSDFRLRRYVVYALLICDIRTFKLSTTPKTFKNFQIHSEACWHSHWKMSNALSIFVYTVPSRLITIFSLCIINL